MPYERQNCKKSRIQPCFSGWNASICGILPLSVLLFQVHDPKSIRESQAGVQHDFNQVSHLELAIGFVVYCEKKGFEIFTSGFAWACCARWVSTLIPVNGPLAVINVKKTSAERAKESLM